MEDGKWRGERGRWKRDGCCRGEGDGLWTVEDGCWAMGGGRLIGMFPDAIAVVNGHWTSEERVASSPSNGADCATKVNIRSILLYHRFGLYVQIYGQLERN